MWNPTLGITHYGSLQLPVVSLMLSPTLLSSRHRPLIRQNRGGRRNSLGLQLRLTPVERLTPVCLLAARPRFWRTLLRSWYGRTPGKSSRAHSLLPCRVLPFWCRHAEIFITFAVSDALDVSVTRATLWAFTPLEFVHRIYSPEGPLLSIRPQSLETRRQLALHNSISHQQPVRYLLMLSKRPLA